MYLFTSSYAWSLSLTFTFTQSLLQPPTNVALLPYTLLHTFYGTLLLCYFAVGAVAGSQLCCALDPHRARRRPDACLGPEAQAAALSCIHEAYIKPLHYAFT